MDDKLIHTVSNRLKLLYLKNSHKQADVDPDRSTR